MVGYKKEVVFEAFVFWRSRFLGCSLSFLGLVIGRDLKKFVRKILFLEDNRMLTMTVVFAFKFALFFVQ